MDISSDLIFGLRGRLSEKLYRDFASEWVLRENLQRYAHQNRLISQNVDYSIGWNGPYLYLFKWITKLWCFDNGIIRMSTLSDKRLL